MGLLHEFMELNWMAMIRNMLNLIDDIDGREIKCLFACAYIYTYIFNIKIYTRVLTV